MKKTPVLNSIAFTLLAISLIIVLPRWRSVLEANVRLVPFVRIAAAQTGICSFDPSESNVGYTVTAAQFERDEQKSALIETLASDALLEESYLTLFWNSAFSVTMDLPVQNYELQVYGKHDRPGPVILRVLANGQILGVLNFDKDDDSWGTLCLHLSTDYWQNLEKLTIQIEFTNDGGEAGGRDASVAWIRFIPLLPAAVEP